MAVRAFAALPAVDADLQAQSAPTVDELSWVAVNRRHPRPVVLSAPTRPSTAGRTTSKLPFAATILVLFFLAFPLAARMSGYQTLVVTGGSMEPDAHPGDAILLRPVLADRPAVGDVVAFHPMRSRQLTTHRVLSLHVIEGTLYLQTKGDANASPDADLVPAANVIGRVVRVVPSIGRAYAFAVTRVGRLVIVVLPAFLIIAAEVLSFLRRPAPRQRPRMRTRTRFSAASAVLIVALAVAGPASARFTDTASVGSNSLTAGQVNAATLNSATASMLSCTITLAWSAPGTGLTPGGYDVLRSTTNGSGYALLKHVGALTTTTDLTGHSLVTYFYVLQSSLQQWMSVNSNQKQATATAFPICPL